MKARHMRRRAAAERGFTLMELMVVVIIVSILAVLAVPSVVAASRSRKAYEAANEVAQIARLARSRAMAQGAAQVLVFSSNGVTDRGTVILYEARQGGNPISSCRGWASGAVVLPAVGAAATPTASYLQHVFVGEKADATAQSTLLLNGVAAGALGFLCFTPKGQPYYSPTLAGLATAPQFTGTYEMDVVDKPAGVQIGPMRRVLIPAGAAPRVRSQ